MPSILLRRILSSIFLTFNLNEGMDWDIKRIGHIEDHFKCRTLL